MALPDDVSTFSLTFGHSTNGYTDATGAVVLPGTKAKLFPVDLLTGRRLNVTHVATGQVIIPTDVTITIDEDGKATVGPLPHTDNAALSPIGFGYRVEWQVASGRRRAAPRDLTFAVPTAAGASVDFDLLDVADAVPGVLVPMGIATGLADTVVAGLIPGPSATATALGAAFIARTGAPTLMSIGDSITANGGGAIDPVTLQVEPTYNPTSYTFWALLLSGGRFLHAGDAATGGYTSAQIRDTHLPTALARRPAYCVTLVGQNSQTDLTAPVQIWEALIGAGITPILCTLPATGTSAALWKFNQFVVRYAQAHGLPLVDFHAVTVDPTTGGYRAGYSGDGTHPTEVGAKAMGQALADILAKIIPNPAAAGVLADTNAASDLVVGNPLLLTDDGGGLASNWTGLAAFTGTFSTNPAVAGRLWKVAAPSAADAAVGASFDVAPGHRYQIACKLSADVEAVSGVWVLRFLSVAPTVNFYTLAEFSKDVPIGSAYAIEWVCPATITTVRFDILAKTAVGASMSIGQFTVRDLTALGLV